MNSTSTNETQVSPQQATSFRKHVLAPFSLFIAVFGFTFLVVGGFGTALANGVLILIFMGWIAYFGNVATAAPRPAPRWELYGLAAVGTAWILLCNAFFVNWNPLDLTRGGPVGGLLVASPFLILALRYRTA